MLDDMTLDQKLLVACEWWRRARAGEFVLSGREAAKFGELLRDCQTQAEMMLVQSHIDAARIHLLDGHLSLLGHAVPALDPAGLPENVVLLRPAGAGQ